MRFVRFICLGWFCIGPPLGYGEQACPPEIESEKKFFGFQGAFTCLQQTTDGGLVVGGTVRGGCLVLRLDSHGNLLWQRSYGGGTSDGLANLQQTSDGGFILAAGSWDRPEGHGAGDYWVIRLDPNGNKIWDRWNETCAAVRQTSDGGFLVGGSSISGADGNTNGNKSAANLGAWDMWLVRLDPNGNKLWDRTYGGRNNDSLDSLAATGDGGFVLAGGSHSEADGNKTSPQWGNGDVWIVRVDANGNKLWDKAYGGGDFDGWTDVAVTSDGGFVLASSSRSGRDGIKTTPNFGTYDFWVLRLDPSGSELWQRGFGGNWDDHANGIRPTSDGGFIVGGMSYSRPSGNKTSPNLGNHDFWVLRLGVEGQKVWETTLGGADYDDLWALEQTVDGGFVLAGRSVPSPWLVRLTLEHADCDGDGVPNAIDLCPDTPGGLVVNSSGCSIEQACPCERAWRNHNEYVKCVQEQAARLLDEGKIDKRERQALIKQARETNCGKP